MSIKEDLRALVQLQGRELELVEIDAEIAEVESKRKTARAAIAAAEEVVGKAERDAEEARAEAKRLDLDLKAAEQAVAKFKDQMLSVKTNEQLWAIQEEIGHAQKSVGRVETRILEQLEKADAADEVIGAKKAELVEETKRIEALVREADRREVELTSQRQAVEAAVSELSREVPEDLKKKYDSIKRLRGGVGVAEVLDEYCQVCNTKVRPQLYVETFNFAGVKQCENCKRIIYVAEPLGFGAASPDAGNDTAPGNETAPAAGGISAPGPAPADIAS